jgi:hypothetical protein
LDEQDISEFSNGDYLFGRKFDFERKPELHKKLIAYINSRNQLNFIKPIDYKL